MIASTDVDQLQGELLRCNSQGIYTHMCGRMDLQFVQVACRQLGLLSFAGIVTIIMDIASHKYHTNTGPLHFGDSIVGSFKSSPPPTYIHAVQ
jgi:hypothetical protein